MDINFCKYIIIFILIFICSGCSATYNLILDKSSVSENIIVNDGITEKRTEDDILYIFNAWYPVYPVEGIGTVFDQKLENTAYYDKNYFVNNNKYIMNYSYKHDINYFHKSFLINYAYSKYNLDFSSNNFIIKINSKNNIMYYHPEFTNFTVNITTDLEVIENDADIVAGNKYTWYFNRGNYETKLLSFKVKLDDSISDTEHDIDNSESDSNNLIKKDNKFYIVGIVLGIILYLAVIVFIAKKRK